MEKSDLHLLLTGLARDFRPWPQIGARFVDEAECLVAVLLAIAVSHLLGIRNVGWAAFSAYIVIRGSLGESLRRGSLRVLGTGAGVSLAWLLAPELLRSTALLSVALALFSAVTLYLALIGRCGYAWLLAGLSFCMVLVDGMGHSGEALSVFAQSRFLEVCVGAGAAIAVSAVSAVTVRRHVAALSCSAVPTVEVSASQFWRKAALRHALQGGFALALVPWVWTAFHFKALSQSSVTIMAVMMVPVTDLAASKHPSSTKLRQRFFGCVTGGLLATGILILSHDSPLLMMLAVSLGVVTGRHIENGKLGICYVGTQFALAFLVVLVPDCYSHFDIAPGIERLFGILCGMALLEPVRLIFQWRGIN